MATAFENPFASTHSLDANPFDDPTELSTTTTQNDDHAAKLDEIRRRELDLERREQDLANKSENLRRNGRNNWPPCTCSVMSFRQVTVRVCVLNVTLSLPPHIPFHSR